mmetsp:Transcript_77902/g.225327  ORF Transcript_77902/g.225327 Transcript_77902/m.225327 type:complete len:232 (-) Transcript_77902:611-1306(-)
MVGQPQGRRGQEHFPGRLPRSGQHRRLRPRRQASDRRDHQPVGRHQLDGVLQLDPHAHGPRVGAVEPGVRKHGGEVFRALLAHRPGDDATGVVGPRLVGRRGRVLLRCPHAARRQPSALEGSFDGRLDPVVRRRSLGALDLGEAAALCRPMRVSPRQAEGPRGPRLALRGARPGRAASAVAPARAPHEVFAQEDVGSQGILIRLRGACAFAVPLGAPVCARVRRESVRDRL